MPQEQMPERIYVIPTGDSPEQVQYWGDERDIWQNGVPYVPASRLSSLAERVERAEALLKEAQTLLNDAVKNGCLILGRCELDSRISSFLHDGTKGKP